MSQGVNVEGPERAKSFSKMTACIAATEKEQTARNLASEYESAFQVYAD